MVKVTKFYGTAWCSDCKISKSFLNEHLIDYDYIDITDNEEAAKIVEKINDGKRKVPTIKFSDGTYLVEPTNAELAEKLGLISRPSKASYDVLIIGGGPAGLTCAIYTAREGMDTVVIEKGALGGRMNYTDRIENYPGFPEGSSGEDLALTFAKQAERFGVEMLKATLATEIEKKDQGFAVTTSHGDTIHAKTVVIATGTEYRTLGVEGEKDLLGYRIHFCAVCDGPFFKDKKVLVIGGGNSALEESLFLARFASEVTVVEIMDELTASKVIQKEISKNPKIKTLTSYETKEFLVGEKKQLEGVRLFDRVNQKEVILKPDGVFMLVGLKPTVKIVKNLVDLDERGFIKTDEKMLTSVPGIFAAGDCRSKSTWQIASAVGEGAIVALKIRDYLRSH
ncbi:MAG: FAD-dependent oxidoreductase [Candidatus Heimdallarchaeota archaeon]|nr:FAD-dependent oxidoreductase [Candidatus Heimdallarchaeota archaeon]MCK5143433.1 FAD-dependent oxidoreductase [Candidatus Heimdallarchaeota archaeon]